MAVGFQFLTKMGGMQDVMAPKTGNAAGGKGAQGASIFNKTGAQKSQNTDMASMSTSDLIKHVYQNVGGNVEIQDKTGQKHDKKAEEEGITLPLTVEYGDQKFTSHGKKLNDVIKDIAAKTGDSTMKIESELKRKYSTSTKGAKQAGASLNMQA